MTSEASIAVGKGRRGTTMGIAVAVLALVAAACGSSGTKTSTATTAAPSAPATTASPATTPTTAAGSAPATVSSANSAKLGAVLVDSKGMTLYTFDPENAGGIKCATGCVSTWPPDVLPSGVTTPTPGPGVTVTLATIMRPDGGTQVTENGHPLYAFAGDKAAGDTNGDGILGKWHAARPTASSTGAAPAPTTTVAGYKY